jgi:hypothetical protein
VERRLDLRIAKLLSERHSKAVTAKRPKVPEKRVEVVIESMQRWYGMQMKKPYVSSAKVSLGNGIVNRLAAESIAEGWRNTVKESLRDGSLAKTLEEFGYDLVKRPKDNAKQG